MSPITTGFLLLAIVACITDAQPTDAGQNCLCQKVRGRFLRNEIKEIQLHQATVFCNKVEIVITNTNGLRYCLNPNLKMAKELVANMLKNSNSASTTSTTLTVSTSTQNRTSANI